MHRNSPDASVSDPSEHRFDEPVEVLTPAEMARADAVAGAAGVLNFALIEKVEATAKSLSYHVKVFSHGPQPLFQQDIQIDRK